MRNPPANSERLTWKSPKHGKPVYTLSIGGKSIGLSDFLISPH
jgi:hypothetical protein